MAGEDADFECEIRFCGEEGDAFAEDCEQRDGEVSVVEETVVENSGLGKPPFVDSESEDEEHADDEWGDDVGVRPGVRVSRPRQGETEEDQARREEEVADPVESA